MLRQKIFIYISIVLTVLLTLVYSLGMLFSVENQSSVTAMLLSPTVFLSLLILWIFSLINTFNCIWKNHEDVLLELIHGFSLVAVLWLLASIWQIQSIISLGDLTGQISNLLITIVVYLSLIRTLLNFTTNKYSNITRWISLITLSISTGLRIVTLFITLDPSDILLINIGATLDLVGIAALICTVLFSYLSKKA